MKESFGEIERGNLNRDDQHLVEEEEMKDSDG